MDNLLACFVLSALIAAGCTRRPAADAVAKAAAQAEVMMTAQSEMVDNAIRKASESHAQILEQIEKAKSESAEARVKGLIHDDGLQNEATYTSTRVYGCSTAQDKEEARTVAEMIGRQLLLFASGAEVTLTDGSLKIRSKATTSGVRVAESKAAGSYTIVQLDASMEVVAPTAASDKRLKTSISKIVDLSNIIQSISQNVAKAMSCNDSVNADPVNGFVILKKMELLPKGNPPQCRYELDVYSNDK